MTEPLKLPPVVVWQAQALLQFHQRKMAEAAGEGRHDDAVKYKSTVELFAGLLKMAGITPAVQS